MLILNVGCGDDPTGHVNTDLFIKDLDKRGYGYNFRTETSNPVCADIHHLPFRNRVFDETQCYQVLEHTGIELNEAIKELFRVTKKTVKITTPSFWHISTHPRFQKAHKRVFTARYFRKLFVNYKIKIYPHDWGHLFAMPFLFVPLGYEIHIRMPAPIQNKG